MSKQAFVNLSVGLFALGCFVYLTGRRYFEKPVRKKRTCPSPDCDICRD